jgi:hypothetical protein
MNIKIVWFITIVSWLFFIMHIVLPFTGVVDREWDSLCIWATLSIVWTTHLVDDLNKKNKKDNG